MNLNFINRSRVNWDEFVRCQVRANETYSEAKHQFSDRNRAVLMNVQSPHKWWSTLKSAVFGTSSSLPPLVNEGGGLVCESAGKADLLSDHLFVGGLFVWIVSSVAGDRPMSPQFRKFHRPPMLPITDRFP